MPSLEPPPACFYQKIFSNFHLHWTCFCLWIGKEILQFHRIGVFFKKKEKKVKYLFSILWMCFLLSHVNGSRRLSPLELDWTGCWWNHVQNIVQCNRPSLPCDMGIAGIPLLCDQQPCHILCVHLLLLCQQPFSYGINIFRLYVVSMKLWRRGKHHAWQVGCHKTWGTLAAS